MNTELQFDTILLHQFFIQLASLVIVSFRKYIQYVISNIQTFIKQYNFFMLQ